MGNFIDIPSIDDATTPHSSLGMHDDGGIFVGSYVRALIDSSNLPKYQYGNYLKNVNSIKLQVVNGSREYFGTGWNLFSIPVETNGFGTILESTCNNTNTVWEWNNQLKEYKAIGSLRPGTLLPANAGLWVNIKVNQTLPAVSNLPITSTGDACSILVSGTKSVTTNGQKLVAGWNSIGAPMTSYGYRTYSNGGASSNVNLLKFKNIAGTCNIEDVLQYLSTDNPNINPNLASPIGQFSSPLFSDLKLGVGYMVKVKNNCTLSDVSI